MKTLQEFYKELKKRSLKWLQAAEHSTLVYALLFVLNGRVGSDYSLKTERRNLR